MKQLTHGSLFAGIGGFDLGFERAGIKTIWQVEIDPFCRKVLEKHWPHVERFADIRECRELPWVDIITGGFPCQDISIASSGAGLEGERSGLWKEMRRIIRQIRPQFVIVENVAALLGRGIERVLADLAESGYDAEWDVLPACSFGAPHIRERIFIIANSVRDGWHYGENGIRNRREDISRDAAWVCDSSGRWLIKPCFCRMDDGIPERLDRLHALGNAVVPQIAEWIGRRIVEVVNNE